MLPNKFNPQDARKSIFEAILEARKQNGGKKEIIEDKDRKPLNYDKLITASLLLGRKFDKIVGKDETTGLLIANSVDGMVAFFALMAFGHRVAMLNFTAGMKNIKGACDAALVKTIITSKSFIEKNNLPKLIDQLSIKHDIIYIEDISDSLTIADKAMGVYDCFNAGKLIARPSPDDIAVVLFTSGTEGAPKGVALSHSNMVSNVYQFAPRLLLQPDYVFFNPLPMFHCFGLTAATLLPLICGLKVFMYPSPLQGKNIVNLIKEVNATVLFSTDTFLCQYARIAHEDDFKSLKYVVCGAERIKQETDKLMREKFGVTIIEGYGVTETAPVIAVNTPDKSNKIGTVGRLLDGVEWRLESVQGINGGGRLFVKGPNVMMGYIRVDAPGEIQTTQGGWHDTGDIATIDEDGYLTIKGRLKRFAKIGGEMVSLTAVENNISTLHPEYLHVALAVSDAKKGEQIILLSNLINLQRAEILEYYRNNGISELSLPKQIYYCEDIPILGTGKIDYVGTQKYAETMLESA